MLCISRRVVTPEGEREAAVLIEGERMASVMLLKTSVIAAWRYTEQAIVQEIEFVTVRHQLRERMIAAFARHDSMSVQQKFHAMAEAALRHTAVIDELFLRMPNKHNLRVDLARFGSDNPNHIFMPTDEPHGTIEPTVRRS